MTIMASQSSNRRYENGKARCQAGLSVLREAKRVRKTLREADDIKVASQPFVFRGREFFWAGGPGHGFGHHGFGHRGFGQLGSRRKLG